MGKYMRKAKVSGEVAVMEVPGGALLGVRTRSRTLALQRAQRPPEKGEAEEAGECLELRSRRVGKPHPQALHKEAAPTAARRGAGRKADARAPPADGDFEVSFGENALDLDALERGSVGGGVSCESEIPLLQEISIGHFKSTTHVALKACMSTRETTPCNLIRSSETISTPGSTTKSKTSNSTTSHRRIEAPVCRFIPSSREMEEFFASAEQQAQHAFREKYNFCPVNDCPLPGRYEWTRLDC
ncbi:hypothetical protein ACP70R_013395 [Stipagrostis hirtigluma subsp. patula]